MFENEINWLDKYFGENSLSTEDYKKHDYRNDKNILNVIEHYDSQKFKCRTIHFEPFNEINEWALKSLFISNPNLRYYIDTKFDKMFADVQCSRTCGRSRNFFIIYFIYSIYILYILFTYST